MATLAKRGSTTPADSPGGAWAGQSNVADGAPGTTPATYATWSSNVSAGVGYIEISGFGFDTGLSSGDTLTSVTVLLRHQESSTIRFSSVNVQPWSGGATVGTGFNCTLATTVRNDSATVGAVTLAQLRATDFKIRITATRTSGTTGSVFYIDHVDVTATYTAASGRPKYWTGSAWAQKPAKYWNGSVWIEKPVKVWTGSAWKTLT